MKELEDALDGVEPPPNVDHAANATAKRLRSMNKQLVRFRKIAAVGRVAAEDVARGGIFAVGAETFKDAVKERCATLEERLLQKVRDWEKRCEARWPELSPMSRASVSCAVSSRYQSTWCFGVFVLYGEQEEGTAIEQEGESAPAPFVVVRCSRSTCNYS